MSEINLLLLSASHVRLSAEQPEETLDIAVELFKSSRREEQLLAIDFNFLEYWRDDKNTLSLLALYHLQNIDDAVVVTATVIEPSALTKLQWQQSVDGVLSITALLQGLPAPLFRLHQAIQLQPISIPKPWGREIWYTGIERRGVAEVGDGRFTIALPWLLAIAPRRLLDWKKGDGNKEPILLKILDPLPEEVFGDLYFEMHQQKQEVYVVTAIDKRAWPDGKGAIRFGFNNELRASYRDDRKFLDDYLIAVRAYRQVRVAIDQQLDAKRAAEGIDLNEPLSAATLQAWMNQLSPTLHQRERTLRAAMERFTGLRPLEVGDVVKVPCLVPHSLQHGVRTVEFQTPVYERLILSFAQKVLTQTEWDTDSAAALLCLDPPPAQPWRVNAQGNGWREEQIVEFDDFAVRRIALEPGVLHRVNIEQSYGLLMAVGADLQLDGAPFIADAAMLLPLNWCGGEVINRGAQRAYLLLATPLAARG